MTQPIDSPNLGFLRRKKHPATSSRTQWHRPSMIGIGGTEVRQVNCSESLSDMLASDQQSSAGHQQTVNNNITRGQSSWIKRSHRRHAHHSFVFATWRQCSLGPQTSPRVFVNHGLNVSLFKWPAPTATKIWLSLKENLHGNNCVTIMETEHQSLCLISKV